MILSPKTRFLQSADAKALSTFIHSEVFLNAVTTALAEMQMNMPGVGNPSQAWDSHCQMTGAKTFIGILLNLSEPSQPPKIPDLRQNLSVPETKTKLNKP